MKRIIFLMLLVFSNFSFSQFTLTENGFINKEDNKNYIVYEFENQKAEELYINVLATLTKLYVSAKDVLSKVENKTISVNGVEKGGICFGKFAGGCNRRFDLNYTFSVDFKDNKIKINGLNVLESKGSNSNYNEKYSLVGGGGIFGTFSTFGKDGKVKDKKSKESIEVFFNTIIETIIKNLKDTSIEDEW